MFYLLLERPDEPEAVRSTSPWVEEQFEGSAEAMAEHLARYRQADLEYALCGFESEHLDDLLHQMGIFAEQVVPRFADAG